MGVHVFQGLAHHEQMVNNGIARMNEHRLADIDLNPRRGSVKLIVLQLNDKLCIRKFGASAHTDVDTLLQARQDLSGCGILRQLCSLPSRLRNRLICQCRLILRSNRVVVKVTLSVLLILRNDLQRIVALRVRGIRQLIQLLAHGCHIILRREKDVLLEESTPPRAVQVIIVEDIVLSLRRAIHRTKAQLRGTLLTRQALRVLQDGIAHGGIIGLLEVLQVGQPQVLNGQLDLRGLKQVVLLGVDERDNAILRFALALRKGGLRPPIIQQTTAHGTIGKEHGASRGLKLVGVKADVAIQVFLVGARIAVPVASHVVHVGDVKNARLLVDEHVAVDVQAATTSTQVQCLLDEQRFGIDRHLIASRHLELRLVHRHVVAVVATACGFPVLDHLAECRRITEILLFLELLLLGVHTCGGIQCHCALVLVLTLGTQELFLELRIPFLLRLLESLVLLGGGLTAGCASIVTCLLGSHKRLLEYPEGFIASRLSIDHILFDHIAHLLGTRVLRIAVAIVPTPPVRDHHELGSRIDNHRGGLGGGNNFDKEFIGRSFRSAQTLHTPGFADLLPTRTPRFGRHLHLIKTSLCSFPA